MLRKLKIGARLNLLIVVAVLAVLAIASIAAVGIRRVDSPLALEVLAASAFGLVVMLAVVGALVRRSVVQPLREIAAQAQRVANQELPQAIRQVQRLDDSAEVAQLDPFAVRGNDEFTELAASLTTLQSTALESACEQVRARRTVAANLVNIGRRNQGLLERTLRFIGELERYERDPDALEHLFQLDHLTTRMRRQAQSLLVLAGATPNRLWSVPLDSGDVVRATLSQIEDYDRVQFGDVGAAHVLGAVTADIAHLLAELLENPTSFSPPSSEVRVVARTLAHAHVFTIIDYGVGMTEQALSTLNAQLAHVDGFDHQVSRMLGLQVVARLAARHSITVTLAQTAGGAGTTAVVELPTSLLAPTTAPTFVPVATQPVIVNAPASSEPAAFDSPVVGSGARVPLPAVTMVNGLSKRVRGAQMPDLGRPRRDGGGMQPTPDMVRAQLSSLQRGVRQARALVESQPVESQPVESQPVESQPVDNHPVTGR